MKAKFFLIAMQVSTAALAFAAETVPPAAAAAPQSPWRYIAAALAVGFACIAGGIAVGQVGSAAMGAMSENPELSGKALPYVGLAEGICLWGFLVALFILLI
ncbi:MAG: ATP synthase subunit C [Treponemataceae bacterium]